MPFSWFRVPSNTSKTLYTCMQRKDDFSKASFKDCVETIVGRRGATVIDKIYFEVSGKYAHVHLQYADEQRQHLIFDLGADQVIDLVEANVIDELAADIEAS